jgi:hypothetical protein
MSAKAISHVQLTPTLTLSEMPQTSGDRGFWLYDKTRGMNLSMRALTPQLALVEALTYYQRRLAEVEAKHKDMSAKVEAFVAQFTEDDTD